MANLIKIDDNDFLVKDYLRQEEINENTLLLNYKTLLKRYLSQGEPSEDTLRSYCSAIDSYIKWCLTNKVHPLKITEYNYKTLLKRYLSQGEPSEDTLRSYCSAIDSYIKWCLTNKVHPLKITEYQFMYYRDFLIKMNMKKGSIKVKLNAIKQFYNIAVKLKLIENSPAKDVGVKIHEASEISPMKFLTLEQLRDLLNIIPDYDEKHIEYLRDKIIIMLMALEGLRTVEVHRMSVNDINWEMKTIYIHGKGHNDFIYPRDDVLILLQEYLKIRPFDFTFIDEFGEPVFTTLTNQVKGKRMDRRGIRYNVDKWLTKAGLKKEGISCHMLRHTCGTLLYKDTKDLQIVKQVLRHSNVNITSKYAHIYNKMDKRYTTGINLNENVNEDKKKAHK